MNGSKRSPRTHQTAHLARASHAPRHVLQEFKHCATTHAPLALIAHRAEQTGESLGARTPCECSPRTLRLAARKPNLTPTSPHICDIRESFQRHILPPVMPCGLASSFSREHNEAYTLLDLQRPASDWASCCQLPSFCDTSLRSGRVLS